MVTGRVRAALAHGSRDAVAQLVEQLATEIDGSESARDRLPLVRAFLAAVAQLEAIDAAAARRAAATGPVVPAAVEPLDELLARRVQRRARR
jgi:hypothetical protein